MPKSNSQQKSTQTPASATSKWRLNREERRHRSGSGLGLSALRAIGGGKPDRATSTVG